MLINRIDNRLEYFLMENLIIKISIEYSIIRTIYI